MRTSRMKTLRISKDLVLEVHVIGERHWLELRDESQSLEDEGILLIRSSEIRKLIDALSEATNILSRSK